MNERIIDIILYLVNQIRQNTPIEQIDLKRLASAGYTDAEIGAAFSWLADRSELSPGERVSTPRRAFRVLHDQERALFKLEAYGYLLQLLEIGLISDMEFEMIINRAHLAGFTALTIADIKELTMTLLAESSDSGSGSRVMLQGQDTIH
jgi:Smg protein